MTTLAPPTGPSAAPPPLTPTGRRALRIVIVAVATILVLGCVISLGIAAWGINALRVSIESKDLPAGMRSLTIDADDANVRLTVDPQAGAPRVDLRTVTSSRDGEQRMDVTSDAAGTRIVLPQEEPAAMDWGRSGDVTVTLPPQLAKGLSVTALQDDGRLVVEADLDQLTAHTTDGNIVLKGNARRADITATDGNIVARQPISVTESFTAETTDGNLDIAFAGAAPRRIDAVSRDGNIDVALPPAGPYLVRAQSGDSTRVRVPETTDPKRAVSEVTVRSDDGNVDVQTTDAARADW